MVDLMNNTTGFEKEFASVKLDPLDFLNIIKLMHNNQSLHTLNLCRKNLTDSHAKIIADMLKSNTILRRLELEGNFIGPEGCKHLADALKVNKSLRYLNLENNKLTDHGAEDSGVEELCLALSHYNTMLLSINLSSNCLTRKCGDFILNAAERNKNLIHIDLNDNISFEADNSGGTEGKKLDFNKSVQRSEEEQNMAKFENKFLFLPKIQAIRSAVEANCKAYDEQKIREWNERKLMRLEDEGVRDVKMHKDKAEWHFKQVRREFEGARR